MRISVKLATATAIFLVTGLCAAQAPASAPSGSTGLCKDGTYYSGATKQGACRGHKGVKDWYGATTTAGAAAAAPAPMPAPPVAAAPAVAAPIRPTMAASAPAAKTTNMPAAVAAPGGGAGQVWANSGTKVYHCEGDKYYGKTKQGAYMSEADAKAKGYHADHGKACQP
jgi:hypothetical protein